MPEPTNETASDIVVQSGGCSGMDVDRRNIVEVGPYVREPTMRDPGNEGPSFDDDASHEPVKGDPEVGTDIPPISPLPTNTSYPVELAPYLADPCLHIMEDDYAMLSEESKEFLKNRVVMNSEVPDVESKPVESVSNPPRGAQSEHGVGDDIQ